MIDRQYRCVSRSRKTRSAVWLFGIAGTTKRGRQYDIPDDLKKDVAKTAGDIAKAETLLDGRGPLAENGIIAAWRKSSQI